MSNQCTPTQYPESIRDLAERFGKQPETVALVREIVRRELRAADIVPGRQERPEPETPDLPTTGDPTIDFAVDQLPIAAMSAMQTCLDFHGTEDIVHLIRMRINAHVDRFSEPGALTNLCRDRDDAEGEELARLWLAYGAGLRRKQDEE